MIKKWQIADQIDDHNIGGDRHHPEASPSRGLTETLGDCPFFRAPPDQALHTLGTCRRELLDPSSEAMIEVSIQVFGIVVEVIFPSPRAFDKDLIADHARWLTDSVRGLAIPPDQIRLRQADVLFGYDLGVQLFGGNGHFYLDPQKASFRAKNARGRADGELLREAVSRFLRHFATEKFIVSLSADAFAKPDSKAVLEEYFRPFRLDPRITKPGAVGYLRLEGWPSDVRFMVEPALETEDSLFLAWTTRFPAGAISENPDKIVTVFVEAADVYGLKLRPLS
jgi:hypothetical protein